jgi:hypothetical protein
MNQPFAPIRRTLAALGCAAMLCGTALAQATPQSEDNGSIPAGGKFKECHGYIRHVSTTNLKVHCIDGNASDQSFLYVPRYATLKDGKSVQTSTLKPETPVRVIYTQSLGIKKAYKIFVADANGNEQFNFRS